MLDQTPMVQTVEASVVSAYNKVLASCATVFRTANPEANVWVFDTQVPFDAAIADPEAYGAPSATCLNADGRSCLWKDDYHPGQALHELVAKGVVDLVGDAFF
jgi:phospholipase/lecithinase/hemolysin